jgi:hypothetical protein
MLSKHVAVVRMTMDPPWDAARAARVLDRALEARRACRPGGHVTSRVTVVWTLVLAGASLAVAFVAFRPLPPNGDPPGAAELRPAAVGSPSDALDGGKHAG